MRQAEVELLRGPLDGAVVRVNVRRGRLPSKVVFEAGLSETPCESGRRLCYRRVRGDKRFLFDHYVDPAVEDIQETDLTPVCPHCGAITVLSCGWYNCGGCGYRVKA
jgi:hypothetical protein